jgi:hypothetical protein
LITAIEDGEEKKEHDHTNQLSEELAEMTTKHAQKELAKENINKLCVLAREIMPQTRQVWSHTCWTNMRTRTKRTQGTENPDAFIQLNMRIARIAHFSFITQVERQLCIVNRGYAIVTKQQ